MTADTSVLGRLRSLIREGKKLAEIRKRDARQQQGGWLAGADSIVRIVCDDPKHPYRTNLSRLRQNSIHYPSDLPNIVGEAAAMLGHLLRDGQAGLLESIADRTRAETFEDFLDHAEAYLRDKRKNEAGVIAGIVFEDTIRGFCRRVELPEKDYRLDALITELARHGHLSPVKAKRSRAAADLRTKAAHAQWDEFQQGDVQATIVLCRELILVQLDTKTTNN